jgi:hypothetical protein
MSEKPCTDQDQHASQDPSTPGELADQAREQAGGQKVRLRVDERDLSTNYANAYRTHLTNEEVLIDFGLNLVTPVRSAGGNGNPEPGADAEVLFRANDRVIMNYATAKRLALTLGQAIRQYEQRFGEIKLNAGERADTKR